jgi:hypothetical protein
MTPAINHFSGIGTIETCSPSMVPPILFDITGLSYRWKRLLGESKHAV